MMGLQLVGEVTWSRRVDELTLLCAPSRSSLLLFSVFPLLKHNYSSYQSKLPVIGQPIVSHEACFQYACFSLLEITWCKFENCEAKGCFHVFVNFSSWDQWQKTLRIITIQLLLGFFWGGGGQFFSCLFKDILLIYLLMNENLINLILGGNKGDLILQLIYWRYWYLPRWAFCVQDLRNDLYMFWRKAQFM